MTDQTVDQQALDLLRQIAELPLEDMTLDAITPAQDTLADLAERMLGAYLARINEARAVRAAG